MKTLNLHKQLELDEELDIIFNGIDDKLLQGDFSGVDLILSQVRIKDFPPVLLCGFLSITFAAKHKLKYRERLAKDCLADPRTIDRADSLYGGLI